VAPVCTPSNTCFLGRTQVHNPNGISVGSAIFAQLTAHSRVSSGMPGHVFSPKTCPLTRGDLDPSNTWLLQPTRVHIPNSISIGSAVFAESLNMDASIVFAKGHIRPPLFDPCLLWSRSPISALVCKAHGEESLYFTTGRSFPPL